MWSQPPRTPAACAACSLSKAQGMGAQGRRCSRRAKRVSSLAMVCSLQCLDTGFEFAGFNDAGQDLQDIRQTGSVGNFHALASGLPIQAGQFAPHVVCRCQFQAQAGGSCEVLAPLRAAVVFMVSFLARYAPPGAGFSARWRAVRRALQSCEQPPRAWPPRWSGQRYQKPMRHRRGCCLPPRWSPESSRCVQRGS